MSIIDEYAEKDRQRQEQEAQKNGKCRKRKDNMPSDEDLANWTPEDYYDVDPPKARRSRKPKPASDGDPLCVFQEQGQTDLANARRLVKLHGDKLRYCHPWGKWLIWDGKRWALDETGAATRLAKDVADSIWQAALTIDDRDTLKFAAATASAGKLTAMLALAASESGVPVLPADLDGNPWLLNCPNGTIDLRTGELRKHRREDSITKLCPTPFDPEAASYHWDRFQEDVADGDASLIDFKQKLYGYCATGDVREQLLCIFHGTGANGKSTELEAVTETLGPDYSGAAPKDLLMVTRGDRHPTELADLHGKRLVVASETENGRALAESLVKQLTGGDTIKARRMKEDFWQFQPTHKLILCTNHKPKVKGTDHAIWRRLRLVPFNVKFEGDRKDKSMPVKLRDERQGILAWIVRGAADWLSAGLGEPECVAAATATYRTSQDIIASFIADCCILGGDLWTKTKDLREALDNWQKEQGDRTSIDGNTFAEGLEGQGCQAKRKNTGRGWQGVGILADGRDAVTP